MYNQFFHLTQAPFSIAPDPRYLFMSERHREALAHLLYGIGSGGGFVLLTGEIGAGKTTVCRCFMEQIPATCRLAYIFNPKLSVAELLLTICDEFHIAVAAGDSVKAYVDRINGYLLASHAAGLNNVLVIDEAQNLSADVLEQLRLLTNLETNERKLLQIILIGQPELRTMLARPELEQLAQRVIARYHLGPLSVGETGSYINHRLAVAGAQGATPFAARLVPLVHRVTGGVPRRINLLCDRALLGAYVENSRDVTRPILRRAATEVFPARAPAARRAWPLALAGVCSLALLGGAAAWQLRPAPGHALPPAAPRPVLPLARSGPPPPPAPAAEVPAALAFADRAAALRELGSLWDAQLDGADPCQGALALGLRCYQGMGGLYEMRLLDRPAVATLREGGKVSYVLVTGLAGRTATLQAGGRRAQVDVSALATGMDGEVATLWRIARGFRDELHAGDRGADVDWLAAGLAAVSAAPAPPLGAPLGATTLEQLRRFQAQQQLKTDGLAGPRTFMRLNQLRGISEPRLSAAQNGK